MGYVAIRGGETAIAAAAVAADALRAGALDPEAGLTPLTVDDLRHQLRLLVDRVMAEGGLHDPSLAALAVKQACGDPLEAAFILRAHRSTLPRLGATAPHDGSDLRLIRRVSAAFKDVPGGQMLGPGTDYAQRLFRWELLDESPAAFRAAAARLFARPTRPVPGSFAKVVDALRAEGLVPEPPRRCAEAVDITRAALSFPAPRSALLAGMTRGETGGLLALAYTTMRGYGYLHPTVAELRVGWLPVRLPHPVTGEPCEAGEVLVTECEIVAMFEPGAEDAPPRFTLGYGACFGHNEVKAIAMAMCDRALQHGAEHGPTHPAQDPEFVLMHIDGIESMGFCAHYKLPHYVTFQSDLDRLRATRRATAPAAAPAEATAAASPA